MSGITAVMRQSIPLVLLAVAAGSCSENSDPFVVVPELVVVPEAEVTRVLEAVLRELTSERHERYVVTREYLTGFLGENDWEQDARALGETLPDSLLVDFASRSTCPGAVPLSSSATGVHSVVDAEDLPSDLPIGYWPEGFWGRFYNEFPDSNGHLGLSPVGFSSDATQALVYASHVFWEVGGWGKLFHCALADGEWVVSGSLMLWIS